MSGLLIRAAEVGDLSAVQQIYAIEVQHGSASFELEPPDLEEITRRWRRNTEQGLPYLVAEQRGEILGYAYAGPYRSRPAYRHSVENSVYVSRQARKQGVATRLLTALLEELEKGPWQQVIAVIGDSANTSSINLHANAGFEMVGTLKGVGYKHDQWLDTVLMQKTLGEQS